MKFSPQKNVQWTPVLNLGRAWKTCGFRIHRVYARSLSVEDTAFSLCNFVFEQVILCILLFGSFIKAYVFSRKTN